MIHLDLKVITTRFQITLNIYDDAKGNIVNEVEARHKEHLVLFLVATNSSSQDILVRMEVDYEPVEVAKVRLNDEEMRRLLIEVANHYLDWKQ